MQNEKSSPSFQGLFKLVSLLVLTGVIGWGARSSGIAATSHALISVCVFIFVIGTILFFSQYRVAAALGGMGILIATQTMTLFDKPGVISHSGELIHTGVLYHTQLNIILFLIGMMIIVGVLKDLGFMTWIIQSIINRKKMTGYSFTTILCLLSALLSSILDEVSSIVVVLALVFQVCETLKIKSTPFVLIAVLCTNIGSSTTMLGNPVGILIGNTAHKTFTEFLCHASPVSICCTLVSLVILLIWFRKDIQNMTLRMNEHRMQNKGLGPLLRIPYRRGLFILVSTVTTIAFHHQIENSLGLLVKEMCGADTNAFLIITPLIVAAILMACLPKRASHYIEHDVEWETLLFFMMLFAISGSLEVTGVTEQLADKLSVMTQGGPKMLSLFVVGLSSIGSAFIDNMTFVAAFSPVISELVKANAEYNVLWWSLLFGACFGGNITVIGSTANIVALGMLEKRSRTHIAFLEWLKIGSVIGVVTSLIAWGFCVLYSSMETKKPHVAEKTPAPIVESAVSGNTGK